MTQSVTSSDSQLPGFEKHLMVITVGTIWRVFVIIQNGSYSSDPATYIVLTFCIMFLTKRCNLKKVIYIRKIALMTTILLTEHESMLMSMITCQYILTRVFSQDSPGCNTQYFRVCCMGSKHITYGCKGVAIQFFPDFLKILNFKKILRL